MRLTRRDALAALGLAAGATAVGVGADVATDGAVREAVLGEDDGGESLSAATTRTLTATAEVVYPSEAEEVAEFVAAYARGRLATDPDRRPGIEAAVGQLDDAARAFHDAAFADLPADRRDATLRSLSVDTAEPVADGTIPQRVRYYVVNDLLYAFYASPAGGELVGTPNPIGYPGGYRTALAEDHRRADPDATSDPTADDESATDATADRETTTDPTADDQSANDATTDSEAANAVTADTDGVPERTGVVGRPTDGVGRSVDRDGTSDTGGD